MSVSAQISQDSLLLVVEAFLIGNVGIGFPLMVNECIQDFFQHEVDERATVAEVGTPVDGVVIGLLVGIDHVLDRKMLENRIQPAEDEGLPESADSSVPIGERVDEFKLVMEDTTPDEQMVIGILQPSEKVAHQVPDPVRRGSDMDGLVSVKNPDASFSEHPGFIDKAGHHRTMGQQKVLDAKGIEFGIEFVGLDGVLDFLDLFQRCNNLLAFQHGLNFTFRQGVALDSQRGMDGFDPIGPPEPQGVLLFHPDCISFQLTGNLRNQIDGLGRYGEGWSIHFIPTFIPTQR